MREISIKIPAASSEYIDSYIALGSNLDQPTAQLKTAIESLQQIPNSCFISTSHFYQTTPVGFTHQPDYINAVACLKTQLPAQTVLLALQEIEERQGRVRSNEKNGPRTLDLDLLLYGEQIISEANLIIPHPRLEERAFVLIPLIEIAPNLVLPNGKRAQDCLLGLGNTSQLVTTINQGD